MGTHTSGPDHVRTILDAVRRIVHALHESSRLAEKHVGLTGAQLFVLQQLHEAPAASLNELASRAHTHQSSVSTVVSRLVDRGLIRRARSDVDARHIALSLTPRGRRLTTRAPDVVQERFVRAIESLPGARRRQLASTLAQLAQAMDTGDRAPAMFFEDRGAGRRPRRRE